MPDVATQEEVRRFVESTSFDGYQAVPLPYGLRVPGHDLTASVEAVLAHDVSGKSLLDVGTGYGLFALEATRRGATRVVGLEPNPHRCAVAAQIAELNGATYSVVNSRLEAFESPAPFDVVLFLNVLHHVRDPVRVLERLIALTNETLIIEFCQPSDRSSLSRMRGADGALTVAGRAQAKLVYGPLLRMLQRLLPIATVGRHRAHTYYLSAPALRNMLLAQNVSSVRFLRSPRSRDRLLAVCSISR